MIVNAIIAEYNPFHQGHLYHLKTSKALTSADYTIVIMSGDFVQRGAPAILDKYTRTKMALSQGADLVLELPALYATASAEYFAAGAVSILNQLGVVNYLCFGSECGDIDLLKKISSLLSDPTPKFDNLLQNYLKEGFSYPKARSMALADYYKNDSKICNTIASPNNILSLEYLKALQKSNSYILPITILRMGDDYHADISENASLATQNYPSAKGIREKIFSNENYTFSKNQLPQKCLSILCNAIEKNQILSPDKLSQVLLYKLLSEKSDGYEKYLDMAPELSDRITNNLFKFINYTDFCDLIKTKNYTHTRISRCLLHILLNITKEEMNRHLPFSCSQYARVLGFKKESNELLAAIKKQASIPMITKLADAKNILNASAMDLLQIDLRCGSIYESLVASQNHTTIKNEFQIPIVIQ